MFSVNYIKQHWQGHQSLAWSFWINLVFLRLLIFGLQELLVSSHGLIAHQHSLIVITAASLFYGVVLCWQIVGVIRAADVHFAVRGNMAMVWGVQLGAILLFVLSALYGLELAQLALRVPPPEDDLIRMQVAREANYRLLVLETEASLLLEGPIELGVTRRVRQLLNENLHIESVVLTSPGGNIFEARGLANEISLRRLNTHVIERCESACSVAFIGGVVRSASPQARFGFHQYRINAGYAIIATDVENEQRRDKQAFSRAGASSEFINRLFSAQAGQMWWPTVQELQSYGVIHSIRQ